MMNRQSGSILVLILQSNRIKPYLLYDLKSSLQKALLERISRFKKNRTLNVNFN